MPFSSTPPFVLSLPLYIFPPITALSCSPSLPLLSTSLSTPPITRLRDTALLELQLCIAMTKIFLLFINTLLLFPEWPRWAVSSGAARSGPELGLLWLQRTAASGRAARKDPQRDSQGAEDQGGSWEPAQGDYWQEECTAGQPQLLFRSSAQLLFANQDLKNCADIYLVKAFKQVFHW